MIGGGRVVAGEEDEDEPVPAPAKLAAPATPTRPVAAPGNASASVHEGEADEPTTSPAMYQHHTSHAPVPAPVPFRLLAEQRGEEETLSDAQKRIVAHNTTLRKEMAVRIGAVYASASRELAPSAAALNGTLHAATELPAVLRLSAANIVQAGALLQTLDSNPLLRLSRLTAST